MDDTSGEMLLGYSHFSVPDATFHITVLMCIHPYTHIIMQVPGSREHGIFAARWSPSPPGTHFPMMWYDVARTTCWPASFAFQCACIDVLVHMYTMGYDRAPESEQQSIAADDVTLAYVHTAGVAA